MLTSQQKRTLSLRVNKGAKLLDEKRRGWWRKVKGLNGNALNDVKSCVLGQAFGHYYTGVCSLDIQAVGVAYLYGFDADLNGPLGEPSAQLSYLAERWIEKIDERRQKARSNR